MFLTFLILFQKTVYVYPRRCDVQPRSTAVLSGVEPQPLSGPRHAKTFGAPEVEIENGVGLRSGVNDPSVTENVD